MPSALIVEDHGSTASALAALVRGEGYDVSVAETLESARAYLGDEDVDIILLDLNLPDGAGLDLLDAVESSSLPAVVLITGEGSLESAVAALRLGVSDYLTKPVDVGRLKSILEQVARTSGLGLELRELTTDAEQSGRFGRIVGASQHTRELFAMISRVAPTAASVLISGESGTGKEVVAQTVHEMSRRRHGQFVAVNCGAIAPNLMESELFGHERGAFTGADRRHRGLFERAHQGTLFFDEITEMAPDLQVKLLRVLETGVVRRLGSEEAIDVDVRVLAATNRPPDAAVEAGKLRRDLFYRINVFHLTLKPIRERLEDLEPLIAHFLSRLAETEGQSKSVSEEALQALRAHAWPGNVRELKNALHRAYVLADDEITPACLPPAIVPRRSAPTDSADPAGSTDVVSIPVGATVAEAEKRLILATLDHLDGNKTQTAKQLGISLKTLYSRLARYEQDDAGA